MFGRSRESNPQTAPSVTTDASFASAKPSGELSGLLDTSRGMFDTTGTFVPYPQSVQQRLDKQIVDRRKFIGLGAIAAALIVKTGADMARRLPVWNSPAANNGSADASTALPERHLEGIVIKEGSIEGAGNPTVEGLNVFVGEIGAKPNPNVRAHGWLVAYEGAENDKQVLRIPSQGEPELKGVQRIKRPDGQVQYRMKVLPTGFPPTLVYFEETPDGVTFGQPYFVTPEVKRYPIYADSGKQRIVFEDPFANTADADDLLAQLEAFDPFFAPEYRPNMVIRLPDSAYGTVISTDATDDRISRFGVSLPSDLLFSSDKRNKLSFYELSRYLARHAENVLDNRQAMVPTLKTMNDRIKGLQEFLTKPGYEIPDMPEGYEPTLYNFMLNPESYDQSLAGIANFLLNVERPENAVAAFVYLARYEPQEMIKRHGRLYHDYNEQKKDKLKSDKNVIGLVCQPAYDLLESRSKDERARFAPDLHDVAVEFNLLMDSYATYPIPTPTRPPGHG